MVLAVILPFKGFISSTLSKHCQPVKEHKLYIFYYNCPLHQNLSFL